MRRKGKKLAALARALASQPSSTDGNPAEHTNPLIAGLFSADAAGGDELAYLWPQCVGIWSHWVAIQTQWRVGGMGGATGLDYAGVRAYLDEVGVVAEERQELFSCIRAAERGSLEGWAEREKNKPK